jgi:hypothetical protein
MVRLLLIKRLTEYYKLERFHTIWISLFGIFLNFKYGWKQSWMLDYSIALVVFILFQGTYYWKIKLNKVSRNEIDSDNVFTLLRTFITINSLLIILFPVFIIILINSHNFSLQINKAWALFAYLFGLAEHINYYHIQLMYDNRNDWEYLRKYKRFKTSAIRRDFNARKL